MCISVDSGHSSLLPTNLETDMFLTKREVGWKDIDLVLFWPVMNIYKELLHHLNAEANKWFKTSELTNETTFLALATGFTFWRPS